MKGNDIMNKRNIDNGQFQTETNPCDLSGEYGIGYTLKGEEFWFDKEDYPIVQSNCWYYSNKGYLQTTDRESKKTIKFHRVIMGVTDPKVQVDHKNHPPRHEHKKDNRKSNLEIVTQSENSRNRSLAENNTSGVTGVYWDKKYQVWKAFIKINQKQIHLGCFNNKEDAIKARKEAEIKYFGNHRYDANN